MKIFMVQAQADAVNGCAEGIEEMLEVAPDELRPGMELSAKVLRSTAEAMVLEAMLYGE